MFLPLHINTKETTIVFPDEQKLWRFFAVAEVSAFRIESSKRTVSGRLWRKDIEMARERFGAVEQKGETRFLHQAKRLCVTALSLMA